jgi:hypothetical protein
MGNHPIASAEDSSLADDIRSSESLFVDAAMKAIRERIQMEYTRLRAYAFETGGTTIALDLRATFNFDPAARSVEVTSLPRFQPEPGTSRVVMR